MLKVCSGEVYKSTLGNLEASKCHKDEEELSILAAVHVAHRSTLLIIHNLTTFKVNNS